MAPISKIAELARMCESSVTLIFRVDVAVTFAVPNRQPGDNGVNAATVRSSHQIALWRVEEHQQIRVVWLGLVVATARMRFDLKIFTPVALQFSFGEAIPEPSRDAVHVE